MLAVPLLPPWSFLGLARTIYIRCIYGTFDKEITKYTVIYGVYIRFWPTLIISGLVAQVFVAHTLQFPGTVLALSWWHRCLLHSPGTVCFLAQSWHCLGGSGVCCTHAAIFLLQPAMGLHAHFYLYSLMINIIVTCIISVLVAQVFVAHTLQFPVATSNGFACTLLPVFFDVKHHSLPELAVPCSERQQHPAGSRRKGSIFT
jgi:hypothetical protein